MAMGIGINLHEPDAGEVKGIQEKVACGVWFTSRGIIMPKFLKYQCIDGTIRELTNIHVISFEKKNYCGIPTYTYNCDAIVENKKYLFDLHYYLDTTKWGIVWKNS